MIWTEELSASLDQSGGVVVFHRVEVSRAQQLALVIADKIGSMVEQNEKTLDIKMGGSGNWGDRGDGAKGEKRGEQTQERRNRQGERRGGARGKLYIIFFVCITDRFIQDPCVGGVGALLKGLETRCRLRRGPFLLAYANHHVCLDFDM